MKKITILLLIFISACASSTKLTAPISENLSAMQEKVPGITLEKANKGYTLYKLKCSGCHRLHAPSEYTIVKWQKILPEMYGKAKMTDDQGKDLVRDYLYSLSR